MAVEWGKQELLHNNKYDRSCISIYKVYIYISKSARNSN